MMESLTIHLQEAIETVSLLKTIYQLFLTLVLVQIIALFRCLYVVVKTDSLNDIKQFLNEYWQWSHLRKNSLTLSLWLSSCSAYLTVWFVTIEFSDVSIITAVQEAPLLMSYITIGLVALVVYTVIKTNDQVVSTRQSIAQLKKMRLYTAFKSVLKQVKGSPITATSWGMWVGTAASATEWLSERWVKKKIDAEMKEALMDFSAYAAMEYLLRMSIVAAAIWIVYA